MFHAIRVSGGLFTEEFLQSLTRLEALKELALTPEEVRHRFYALLSLYERQPPLSQLRDTSRARESWLLPFFRALGFQPVFNRSHLAAGDQSFPISHRGWDGEDAPPLHLVRPPSWFGQARGERSPQALLPGPTLDCPPQSWGILPAAPWEVRLLRKYCHVSPSGARGLQPGGAL